MQSHHDMTWLCIQPCIYDIFPVQGQTQNNKISPRLLITPRFVYLQANDKCVLKFVVYIYLKLRMKQPSDWKKGHVVAYDRRHMT